MFDSLDDTMKRDEQSATTSKERMIRYVAVAAASVLVFGGIYFGVRMVS